jgi:hypothetical protein
LRCSLPVGKTHLLHNIIDVGNDALDNNVGVAGPGFGKEFGQCFPSPVALFLGVRFLFRLDDVLGDFQNLFQEF